MIRPIGRMPSEWVYPYGMRMPRSGTGNGALGRQLSALDRRHRLRKQQQEIQAGMAEYRAYPPRPRPPS